MRADRPLDAHGLLHRQRATPFIVAIVYGTETIKPDKPLTPTHKCSPECRWSRTPARESSPGNLSPFSGRPLDRRNLGCALPSGTLYCEIGDPRHWDALVVVDQDDLPFVRLGLPVELKIDELPDVLFRGTVDEISQHELTETSNRLSNKSGGEIATQTNESGAEIPLSKSYQVRVAFDDPEGLLRQGLRGTAKIRVAREALGSRCVRWCARTFQLRL